MIGEIRATLGHTDGKGFHYAVDFYDQNDNLMGTPATIIYEVDE